MHCRFKQALLAHVTFNGNRAVNGGGIYIVDLDGNPRIALGIMVMGAYEYQPTSYIYLPLIFGGIGP
jgi:predicted outer membrane repeat protein